MREPRLAEIADVFNGKTPSKADQRDSGHPVLKVRDLDALGKFRGEHKSFVDKEFAAKHRVKWARTGDTVILNAAHSASHVASKSGLIEPEVEGSLLTGEWLVVRTGENADARYVHYWLSSALVRKRMKDSVKGIHLYPRDVATMPIPLPPLQEQRRIAAILDHADALRSKRRQVLAHLDALTQSIFHDMFGDPDAAIKTVPFGEVAGLSGGRNLVADDSTASTNFRVLKINAVTSGEFKPWESKPLPKEYEPPQAHLVREGDLLMSRANTAALVGAVAYVHETPSNLALPDKVWRFEWRDEASVPAFYHSLLQTKAVRRRISRLASGTGGSMKNVSKAKLNAMTLPLVPPDEQQRFASVAANVAAQRAAALSALTADDELFSSLQFRAFKGEL